MKSIPRPPAGYLPRVTQPDRDAILLRLHDGQSDTVYEITDAEAATLYADLHAILMRRLHRLERTLSQTADVMYIAHPDVAPYKLSRLGHASWTLASVSFVSTPADWTSADYPRAVAFFADPDNGFVTGLLVLALGGWTVQGVRWAATGGWARGVPQPA